MYSLHVDVEMTRRKRMHHVTDNNGDVVFSSGEVFAALSWLLDSEHYSFLVEHRDGAIRCCVGRHNP